MSLSVFISHATEDVAFGERLARDLRRAGADVWLDASHIGPGDFVARINHALKNRDVLVLVLTPAALRSQWVPAEVNAAIVRYTQGFMRAPVIVLARPVSLRDIPALWTTYHRIDATASYDAALPGVVRALGLAMPAAPQAAAPPATPAAPPKSSPPIPIVPPDRVPEQGGSLPSQPHASEPVPATPVVSRLAWRPPVDWLVASQGATRHTGTSTGTGSSNR